jgi:hypothetical protein
MFLSRGVYVLEPLQVTSPCISQPGIPVPDHGREEFNLNYVAPRAKAEQWCRPSFRITSRAADLATLRTGLRLSQDAACVPNICANSRIRSVFLVTYVRSIVTQ